MVKNIKLRILLCTLTITGMMGLASPAAVPEMESPVIETMNNEDNGIMPITEIKEWYYKMFGEHLYKRLFNASTGRWETDWILVY